jgi:hypothetical protein
MLTKSNLAELLMRQLESSAKTDEHLLPHRIWHDSSSLAHDSTR